MGFPLIAKKGGRVHARSGWVFVVAMGISALTGLVMAGSWIAIPDVIKPGRSAETVRDNGVFLGSLALLTASAVWHGVRAIHRKRSQKGSRHPVDVGISALQLLAGLGLSIIGIGRSSVLFIAFGALCMLVASEQLYFTTRPLSSKMAWWYAHMGQMLGAVVAAVTAFTVLNAGRWLQGVIPDSFAFIPWLAPALIVVPLAQMWIRYYRRRFERQLQSDVRA